MQIRRGYRLIAIAGLLAAAWIPAGCGQGSAGKAQGQAGPPEVAFVEMKPERVAIKTELPGRVSAFLIAEVRPQVSGIIQQRLFKEGSDVKAGEVLYQIDPSTYQAAYDSARAALARAEANVTSIRFRAERYKELVEIKAVSRQEYDDAVAALKQAEAEIEAGNAAVEAARINLAYTRVTAPITGRIGKSSVTEGALVTANQPVPLATIQQIDPVYVDVTQSSASLLRLQESFAKGTLKRDRENRARAKLILEDGTPYPLEGTLQFRDVTVDPTTGSLILRAIFPNPKRILLPGMFARAVLEEGVNEKALLVPQQGVSRDPKGNPLALVVDAESKVQQRVLTLERTIGDKWLVSAGLAPGDRVIVEGVQKVRPGSTVRAVPFTEAKAGDRKTAAPPAAKSN
ncbi:MAG TPA: efflux RND transporter periplasmic adaptor subunit [Syntrophales bacterium]|nr:efflux RND transporter periplasmic adaptor subunit [Syntrophobacterales bacterium]HNQ00789.1 efflux RND transporter periplasmic adaptor subunit [Syntrophales bacterium]HNS54186.1 efflux RND transporter periplasmic adaptor subunit [Syntrophales bacterium]HQL90077.1 efflux RND transporter periplasmic adaptor subunit [Syntrophales bacterium]